jgi:hypothetical protein
LLDVCQSALRFFDNFTPATDPNPDLCIRLGRQVRLEHQASRAIFLVRFLANIVV